MVDRAALLVDSHRADPAGHAPARGLGVVNLDGDEADVQSSAVVYGVRGEPLQLRLRGISYRDRFVRTAARFKYDYGVRYYTTGFRVVREK